MDALADEDSPAVAVEAQPDSPLLAQSPHGRPKRKRAAGKTIDYDEIRGGSDGDSSSGSNGGFGTKRGARGAAPKAKAKPRAKPKTTPAKPRAKPEPKGKPKAAQANPKPTQAKPEAEPEPKAKPEAKSRQIEDSVSPAQRPRRSAAIKGAAATAVMATGDAISGGPSTSSKDKGSLRADSPGTHGDDDDDDVYKRLFAPMTDDEIQQWQGWCDIESEPDFFNFILHELGVRNASVQEVYGIDKDTLRSLDNPLGLIFLYKYVAEDDGDVGDGCPDALWFANQTTDNACGTVAMLNICMNQPVALGRHLSAFKDATRHLHPALRGHMLSADAYIRSKHNSFARRLDMLSADAHLRESWVEAETRNKGKKRLSKSDDDEAAFHFIAYVPVGDDVWELNGMQQWPLKLGPSGDADADAKHWTSRASERIAARVEGYDGAAGFVLLALCGKAGTASDKATAETHCDDGDKGDNDDKGGNGDNDDTPELRVAAARKRDYTPAVYCWLKKLADKGVLRKLATGDDES